MTRSIAREVCASVNTVRKYLKYDGNPKYKDRPKLVTKLAPYKDYLSDRIKSAHPVSLPGTVLFQEIKELGYTGGMTQLRDYLRSIKPAAKQEDMLRFETASGKQMQVDWIEFRKGKRPLSAFVATLGFSRASYVEFVTNEKLVTLIECHKWAFEYFGGVPEEVLYDNMKTVILDRDTYGPGIHRFNKGMLDFAKHYSFRLKVCRPYRAKTKGKVERFNRYIRESFYNPLATKLKTAELVLDVDTANSEVLKWLRDTANRRVHGTTGEIPAERLKFERSNLQPLPLDYSGSHPAALEIMEDKRQQFSTVSLQHSLCIYQSILEAL
ncbi:IS21 family transposase [Rickettsia endosymbiont of Pantilius tunicatus]|uniref:IS21 family transposase n=1 Tax=Rickettsia endosymbiont of Pantilius tunicatus TaxID=3066267 RepID=UPI00376EEF22